MVTHTRHDLRTVPLSEVWPPRPGAVLVTMRKRQWDALLRAAYDAGAVLLEVDAMERPVRAYQKAGATCQS